MAFKAVYQRMSNEYLKTKAFVLDKGSLGETPMTSFTLGISMCEGVDEDSC